MAEDFDLGLALSGGGFRATLYHLGSLWRLNELGLLRRLNIITSVSGGSIISGALAACWHDLDFQEQTLSNGAKISVAKNFQDKLAKPIFEFCALNLDVTSFLKGVFSPSKSRADELADAYDKYLLKGMRLDQLPDDTEGPRFVFYATNLQTGVSVRIQKKRIADYRIGEIENPQGFPLSKAVAASSAFPPVFSPMTFKFDANDWKSFPGADLFGHQELKENLIVADGGVYDNMGLEAMWDRCKTVLVSDAGAPLEIEPAPNIANQMGRVRDILIEQTRALRKRMLVADFSAKRKAGTYWGITTKIENYALTDAMITDTTVTAGLQKVSTRLSAFPEEVRGHLINWGYALADAAVRKHVDGALAGPFSKPTAWPMSGFSL